MDVSKLKLVVFDLDGTLTQHKTPLSEEHRQVLDALGKNISCSWPVPVCATGSSSR